MEEGSIGDNHTSMPKVEWLLIRILNGLYPSAVTVNTEAGDELFNKKYPSFHVTLEMEVFLNCTVAPAIGCWVNRSKTCPITRVSFWAATTNDKIPKYIKISKRLANGFFIF